MYTAQLVYTNNKINSALFFIVRQRKDSAVNSLSGEV